MKKEDIEKLMDLSFLLGREKYARDVSLVDIYDISCKIWDEIQKEPKENYDDVVEYILFDRYQWEEFKYSGNLRIDIDSDHKIEFMYKPYAFRLESGEIVDSDTNLDEDEGIPEGFFDYDYSEKSNDCEGNDPSIPLINSELDSKIITWIVEHIKEIQEVLGFDIHYLEKNKILENHHHIDLYGEDNFGNSIVFYGDNEESTDKTLQLLLFDAITSDSQKAIWVANEVQEEHACIINWLNENHVGDIRFYLIEAKRITTLNNKTAATAFRLVESPETGWRDWE